MKKILLFTMIFVGAYSFSSAQVSGGIKGGVNFANVDSDGNTDGTTGYHAGVFLNIGFAGISLQPEVLYSLKGYKDVDLTYVEIPILLKKNFAKVVNIHLGPQFGFLTKAEADFGGGSQDIKDQLKGSDLSVVLGAGVDLPMGLSGGLRYVLGLSDIDDSPVGGGSVKNRTFQVYVGYKLFGK
ncbi:MAG TPA: porin family protein [Fulvivirga sp.]|nr:porin family protein [Fulvivirga sp.]